MATPSAGTTKRQPAASSRQLTSHRRVLPCRWLRRRPPPLTGSDALLLGSSLVNRGGAAGFPPPTPCSSAVPVATAPVRTFDLPFLLARRGVANTLSSGGFGNSYYTANYFPTSEWRFPRPKSERAQRVHAERGRNNISHSHSRIIATSSAPQVNRTSRAVNFANILHR